MARLSPRALEEIHDFIADTNANPKLFIWTKDPTRSSPPLREGTMRMKPMMTLDDAKKMMAVAEAEAARNRWEVVIAILNDGGRIVALHRMDERAQATMRLPSPKRPRPR